LKQVVFMPGWSAFAESAEAAVGVEALNLVWPGTEPKASQGLEKIGFKRICSWDDVEMLGLMVKLSARNMCIIYS
jgi:hypothetical protein